MQAIMQNLSQENVVSNWTNCWKYVKWTVKHFSLKVVTG